ncbi:MAG TPA: glycosyltransferase [Patescibacteria group bacterium]
MNIAIFTNNYLPNPYGVSTSVESFRKQFEKMGHKVYIFAPKTKGFVDNNPDVFRFPSVDLKYKISFPLAIPYSQAIWKKLDELHIDVIHSQHPNLLGWSAKHWAKKKRVPLVFTWHTLYDHYAHFAPFIPKKIAADWAISNAVSYANSADQVVVPTPSVTGIIHEWGVKNSNIISIPTGVEEELYQNPDREIVRKKYGVADDEVLLLLVSRLTAEKNVHFLFASLVPLLRKNKNIKFLVVGEGDERGGLEKTVAQSGLDGQVFFAGVIGSDAIKDYYAAADIFVHASKSETQGMILTEAIYSGLPVVSVVATGAKNVVMNHFTGLLVKDNADSFAHAVLRLANDKSLRQTFSENAKRVSRQYYTSSVCAEKMLKVYEEAIRNKNFKG